MTNWSITPFAIAQGLISLFTLFLSLAIWQRRGVPGSRPLALMLLAVAVWALMTGLDVASVPLSLKILWSKIQYLGVCASPLFLFLFILEYTNQEHLLTRNRLALLWIIPLITIALASTNEIHHLIWSAFVPIPGTNLIFYKHGSWFWVYAAFAYLLVLASFFLLFRALIRYPDHYRQQSFLLIVATLFPWLGNFIYISDLAPGYDLTPTGFAITGLLLGWSTYRHELFDLIPVARERVLEWIEDGLIVLDDRNRVADLNLAAEQILFQVVDRAHLVNGRWLGQDIRLVIQNWPDLEPFYPFQRDEHHEISLKTPAERQFFDLRVSVLSGQPGKRTGKLLLLHEITPLKRTQQETLRAREIAEALYSTSSVLSSTANFTQGLEEVLDQIGRVVACDGGAFILGEDGSLKLSTLRGLSLPDGQAPLTFPLSHTDVGDDSKPLRQSIVAGLCAIDPSILACLATPIVYQARLTGMLVLFRRSAHPFSAEDERIAASLATQVSIALANVHMLEQVQQMAATDGLTGLNNRRHFFTLALHLFDHSARYHEPFSVIIFDLDNFKQVNDTYGHMAGDEVLRAMSALCCRLIRKVDVFARYGGEEFVIALPKTDLVQAGMVAERLRRGVAQTDFTYRDQFIHVTISLGMACSMGPEDTLENVLEQADRALYQAKQEGRNCVRTYSPAE